MGFMLPPSRWEIEHAPGIAQGSHYLDLHGDLPATPMWRLLERRFDLNEARFARWHPNVALLIRESRTKREQGGGGSSGGDPIVVVPPICPPAPQPVPEPSGLVLVGIALAAMALFAGRKRP